MEINKEDEILKIIDALYECYFDELSDIDSFEEDVVNPFRKKYGKEVKYAAGASKGVLLFEDLGFVIKIPFSYDNYGEDLTGAFLTEDGWNYCEQEQKVYESIKEPEFQKMFLKTERLTDINGYPIYIQDYADSAYQNYQKYGSRPSQKDCDKVTSISDQYEYPYIDAQWEAEIFIKYGEKFYINFKKKIEEYQIDDLRSDNVGYVNGNPVIIDYAWFYE